jgi:alkylation response protein AidB-like acyl-CoA dehydrogenase
MPNDDDRYDVPWCLTDEQRQWRQAVRQFCRAEIAPGALERGLGAPIDDALLDQIGELGIFGLLVPEEYGGAGADVTTLCLAIEAIAEVDSSLAVTAHVQAISAALFHHLSDDAQREKHLPAFASGEQFVAFGLTEPTGGSDAGNIATRAMRDGDSFVIDGQKEFITNSGFERSKYVTLFAATGPGEPGRPAVSALLVPLAAEGVSVAPAYAKMGWRGSDTHPLFFDSVRVDVTNQLGVEGRAYKEALAFLTWARLPIAAMCTGLAQGCLDATCAFVEDRRSFQKPLGSHQGVAFPLADIAAMTATARVLTYDACWKYDRGLPIEREAAIAKLVTSELANKAAYIATQLHGGYGFVEESDAARHYRDARILTIGEGTSEVQRLLIARQLGIPL